VHHDFGTSSLQINKHRKEFNLPGTSISDIGKTNQKKTKSLQKDYLNNSALHQKMGKLKMVKFCEKPNIHYFLNIIA